MELTPIIMPEFATLAMLLAINVQDHYLLSVLNVKLNIYIKAYV